MIDIDSQQISTQEESSMEGHIDVEMNEIEEKHEEKQEELDIIQDCKPLILKRNQSSILIERYSINQRSNK